MHFSPHPTPSGGNQPTAPARIPPGPGPAHRTATGLVGLVVFLPCQNPCCEPRPQQNASTSQPAISVRGASDAEAVARAARPHSAKALRLPRP